jgi:hypothetical protein
MPQEPLQILTPDGQLVGEPPVDSAATRDLYEAMVVGRVYDRKCTAMQKQGRLATYAPFEGQEACQIGAVAPLNESDWLVATYRDAAAMWFAGYPMVNLILGRTGDERGGQIPDGVNVLPPSITVGGHMIHAVGTAFRIQEQGLELGSEQHRHGGSYPDRQQEHGAMPSPELVDGGTDQRRQYREGSHRQRQVEQDPRPGGVDADIEEERTEKGEGEQGLADAVQRLDRQERSRRDIAEERPVGWV